MQRSVFFTLLLFFLVTYELSAQRFTASIILGSNFAQIDGDDLAGFSKLGLSAGFLTHYELKKNRSINIELLYNQSGSKSALSFGKSPGIEFIGLNYIDIPILFRIYDWEIEERFYKVFAEGGISIGRLFNAQFQNSFFTEFQDDFTKTSIALAGGVGFRFTERVGFTSRYTRAVNSLYKNEAILQRRLFGYFLTFRLEYKL